jgi:hypothetical protein
MTLSPDARLVPRPDVAAREIEDGAVLVNMGSGACFELNRIGFEIWKALGARARRWAGSPKRWAGGMRLGVSISRCDSSARKPPSSANRSTPPAWSARSRIKYSVV